MATLTKDEFESINKLESVGAVILVFLSSNARLTAEQARILLKRAKNEVEENLSKPYSTYVFLSSAYWFNVLNYNLDFNDPEFDTIWKEASTTREEMYSKIEKYIKAH